MLPRPLREIDLAGIEIQVQNGNETRSYTLLEKAGSGEKAVTWKSCDAFGIHVAIKLVAADEYRDHSLNSELTRVRRLGPRFARIEAFGKPRIIEQRVLLPDSGVYAIVVEWVDGETLEDYCRNRRGQMDVPQLMRLAEGLCEALAHLQSGDLCHNDLHSGNVMVVRESNGPSLEAEVAIKIIDTGSLTSRERRDQLIEAWQSQFDTLSKHQFQAGSTAAEEIERLKSLLYWWRHTDQEWIVRHLCELVSLVRSKEGELPGGQRRFLRDATSVLSRMVDPDPSMRIAAAGEMYNELDLLWQKSISPTVVTLTTPFEYSSAELIRDDKQFNSLFSRKCPWFDGCASLDPVYIYGPRGCGKSTILRKLAVPAVLAANDGKDDLSKLPFIGVYLSCSSELRSRFWLFPEERYIEIQADAILFFSLLLAEALLDTLEHLRDGVDRTGESGFGLTNEAARKIFHIVCERFEVPNLEDKLRGLSWLTYARRKLAFKRNEVWRRILTQPSARPPDPSIVFDICKELETVLPLLSVKHIAFLLDDYSNQRIPAALQRMLNQTISFARQGNPIFKVSSEYQGVDLDGIQEGREVVEYNLGREYVDIVSDQRSAFLEDVINIRFREAGVESSIEGLLGRSGVSPGVPMARLIRDSAGPGGKDFHYHGIDTISDLCSGDLAMALDLTKQIYLKVCNQTPLPSPVSSALQHQVVREYAAREHTYIRYFSKFGSEISRIIEWLCWLAHECAAKRTSKKDGQEEPMIKTHLDIAIAAVQGLAPEMREILFEMERKGVLFSLDTSRSRAANQDTERYQVRRILLAKSIAPLARRDPVKLDTEQRLLRLLTEPKEFAQEEATQQMSLRF